jgi:hypothetical protein
MLPLNFLAVPSAASTDDLADSNVELSAPMVKWADRIAQISTTTDALAQWQVYLRSLALVGFATWMSHCQPSVMVHYDQQSATCVCYVANRCLAIVPVIDVVDGQICISQADLGDWVGDRTVELLVFVALQVESHPARTVPASILGALRRDQLSSRLTANDKIVDDLVDEIIEISQLIPINELLPLLKRWDSAHYPLPRPTKRAPLSWIQLPKATQPTQNKAGNPEKSVLAPFETSLTALLDQFHATDIAFPPETSGVYTDLAIAEYKLRLYALVWSVTGAAKAPVEAPVEALIDTSEETDLSLFLILGPVEGSYLPMGTRLTVKENNLLLTDQNLRWTSHPTYLYTQVFGAWKEKFTVEVLLPNARPILLPPLAFEQDTQI